MNEFFVTLQYEIAHYNSLINVSVSGDINSAGVRELWKAIVDACNEHDCYDILGVSNLDEPFSALTAFQHHEIFSEVGVTNQHHIAWVDQNKKSAEIFKFTETVLINRGKLNGALFDSIEEGKRWLAENRKEKIRR